MRWLIFPILLILVLAAGCDLLPFGGNGPPVAYIDSISPTTVGAGETVVFNGHGTDVDGTVVGYKWRSDIDGEIGNLANFDYANLTEGNHTIYLAVQDNTGDWSEEVAGNVAVGTTSGSLDEEGAFDVEQETSSESSSSGTLPYINYLTAEPAVIAPGGASVVRWSVSNAESVIGSYGSTVLVLPATGSGTVRPTRTTVYTVSATSGSSTVSATVTVTVTAGGAAPSGDSSSADSSAGAEESSAAGLPVFNSLSVSPTTIDPGGTAQFSYSVSNATSLTLTSPTGTKSLTSMSGTVNASPVATFTYTFTATNAVGSTIKTMTVNVSGPPVAEGLSIVGDTETVNLARVSGESGSINSDHVVSSKVVAGDSSSNKPSRAYLSFNISSLAGKDIDKAELLCETGIAGNPWPDLGTLGIYRVSYGPHPLTASDYSITGPGIVVNLPQAAVYGPINITSAVRSAVASHDSRFQVRLNFVKASDNDNKADNCGWVKADLKVTYH